VVEWRGERQFKDQALPSEFPGAAPLQLKAAG